MGGYIFLFIVIVLIREPNVTGFSVADETALRTALLSNYSAKTRPDAVTNVNIIFNLLTINDLETRSQAFSVSGFFVMVWDDGRLMWNKASYNGIGFFFSNEAEIWRPALVVRNAVDDLSVIADEDVPCRVTDNGRVFWTPPGIYKTNCDIDTTYYPFDTQTCSLVLQSWGYNLKELNLTQFDNGVDTSEFQPNGEWELLEATSLRSERLDGADANTYATLSFNFKMKRRTDYYGLNIILPVIVLSVLSTLVFILPADSGEKMGYSLTVLLSFAVFLTLISDRMPTTSKHTSYMALYLSITLCLCGISVLLAIGVLGLHFREDKVKGWVKSVTRRILMPLVCVRGCSRSVGSANITNRDSEPKEKIKKSKVNGNDPSVWSGKNPGVPPVVKADDIEEEITWKVVARVLDALFFRIFILCTLIVTVIFFTILGVGGANFA